MDSQRRFIGVKTKIMAFTLVPVIASYSLICAVIFSSLFRSFRDTASAELLQVAQKYASHFENKIGGAMNYLTLVASMAETQAESGVADRELLQKTVLHIFDSYGTLDGSSIYFEPNRYDGRDADYIGTPYGTDTSGRICYYFYKDGGGTAYLPEGLSDDVEFTLPHYTVAKQMGCPVYTEPTVHEVDGRSIPMFTLTYPIQDASGAFIGAATVDLFLEDIYTQLQNEQIYETGYVLIANDNGQVIYSPRFEDIGKAREEVGLSYALPAAGETLNFFDAQSHISGKEVYTTTTSLYIAQLGRTFYVSVSAPKAEVDDTGTRLMAALILFSLSIVTAIAMLLFYLISRTLEPIGEITECANKIADGDMEEARFSIAQGSRTVDEVYILYLAIKKMLLQLNEIQQIKLESLELRHEKEKAEASEQAKNDFLARMSHEIRTPMNAVMGMSELILRKELPQDVYENAMGIKSASVGLLSIINDILDFSKIESGKLEIVEAEYQFPSLINDIIGIIRIRLMDKPVQFAVNVDSDLPANLIGDGIRIRQILLNLLSNAVKYTVEGHISLTITGEPQADGVLLTMKINDSGIGIKEEDKGRLFGDFVQIAAANKGVEGTGLGLAITRSLCRAMGGDVTVRSEYGKGSVFIVTLPQRSASDEPFATVSNPAEKGVLLYETRWIYRDSIAWTLEDLGVPVQCAPNISSLLENLGAFPYIFASSYAYGSIQPALSKMDNPPALILLADVTETLAPQDARLLALPAYPLSIANILGDVGEDCCCSCTVAAGFSFVAPDAKVLIVDDVMANLKVAEGLMSPYEMQISTCTSGREAIELVAANRYDLVFMDHMMPEMDGLEATGLIRAMEGEAFRSLPIVALSANAISGVREMFIQNGLNDFLAKPIETVKLDAILVKWIPKEKRRKNQRPETREQESVLVEALRTIPELSVDRALAVMGGSSSAYERILKLSIRLLPDNLARLNTLLGADLRNYGIEVHGVKGVLNNIGAYALGDRALVLEEAARDGDKATCAALHPAFAEALGGLVDSVMGFMGGDTDPDRPLGDTVRLRELLPELARAVEFFDSAHALEMLESATQYRYGEEMDQALADLAHAFEQFDFDSAENRIAQLAAALNENG